MDEKAKYVNDWKSSGKTQREFCELNELNLNTFQSWVRKIAAETAAEAAPDLSKVGYEQPFFVRQSGPFLRNIGITDDQYIPCRLHEKYLITSDMDINVLRDMSYKGLIVLYGV
jgi:hypothetical protein